MKFGISFIAAIALVFACLASASGDLGPKYKGIKDYVEANHTKEVVEKFLATELKGATVLTYDLLNGKKDDALIHLLDFDEEYQEAKVAHDAYKKLLAATDAKKEDIESAKVTYEKELSDAENAFKTLEHSLDETHKASFAKMIDELKIKPANPPPSTTFWYKNPIYITAAVVVIIIVLVCIWALFFRKKAEDL